MITHKEHIIKYFESGIKDIKDFKIGIEHDWFEREGVLKGLELSAAEYIGIHKHIFLCHYRRLAMQQRLRKY